MPKERASLRSLFFAFTLLLLGTPLLVAQEHMDLSHMDNVIEVENLDVDRVKKSQPQPSATEDKNSLEEILPCS